MSVILEICRDKPLGLWNLSGTSPFSDQSGYGSSASLVGTIRRHASLGNGLGDAAVVSDAQRAQFAFPTFTQGFENRSFTIEAVCKSISAVRKNYLTYSQPYTNTTNWGSWYGNGTGTFTRIATGGPLDGPFIRVTLTAASTQTWDVSSNLTENVLSPNQVVSGSIYGRTNEAVDLIVGIQWHTSTGTVVSTIENPTPIPVQANTWTRLKVENIVVPAGAARGKVMARRRTGSIGSTLDATMATLEISPTVTNYFDGSYENASWDGAANSSSSTLEVESGEQQILGHVGTYDGLVIDGTVVSFVTKYTNAGEARASYDIGTLSSVDLIGVHLKNKNQLFVNGELVSQVDISGEQQSDTYLTAGTTLYSGQTESGRVLALGAVAVYNYPVSGDAPKRHAAVLRNVPSPGNISQQYGGTRVVLPGDTGDIYLRHLIDEDFEWNQGKHVNTRAQNGILYQQMDGASIPGHWLGAVPLSATDLTSIYGVTLTWSGKGEKVETSLDGITWTTVKKGEFVSQVPNGFNPTAKTLQVRVSFENISEHQGYVSNLQANCYKSGSHVLDGFTVSLVGRPILGTKEVNIDYSDEWGIILNGSTDAITISPPDAVEPGTGIGTIELWVKNLGQNHTVANYLVDVRDVSNTAQQYFYNSASIPTFEDSSYGQIYLNGQLQPVSGIVMPVGEWMLLHVYKNNITPTTVNIGQRYSVAQRGKFQVGHVAMYQKQLTTTEIKAIYDTYTGIPTTRVNDTSSIGMSVPGNGASVYAHDWSIQSAG